MKYAVLYQEVADRRDEITNEEFWLYFLIVLSSFVIKEGSNAGMRVCEIKKMRKFCIIHNLDYHNTQRRIMRLRTGTFANKEPVKKVAKMQTPWIYKTNDGDLLPLVGIKEQEIVKNTIFMDKEIVKNTNSNCKKYKKSSEKIVKNTTPFKKDLNNSLNNSLNKQNPGERERDFLDENENGNQSEFTMPEILKYIEILKSQGANILNPQSYALRIQESNKSDAFIKAALYPEIPSETTTDAKDEEIKANCPRCFGGGMEFIYDENGSQLGVRPGCKHKPLVEGEWLYQWRAENADA